MDGNSFRPLSGQYRSTFKYLLYFIFIFDSWPVLLISCGDVTAEFWSLPLNCAIPIFEHEGQINSSQFNEARSDVVSWERLRHVQSLAWVDRGKTLRVELQNGSRMDAVCSMLQAGCGSYNLTGTLGDVQWVEILCTRSRTHTHTHTHAHAWLDLDAFAPCCASLHAPSVCPQKSFASQAKTDDWWTCWLYVDIPPSAADIPMFFDYARMF